MVMKKPEMNINGHDIIEWFEVEGITPEETKEAYSEMIDALIECHEYIDIQCKFQDDDNMKQVACKLRKDIGQALEKAGVTDD